MSSGIPENSLLVSQWRKDIGESSNYSLHRILLLKEQNSVLQYAAFSEIHPARAATSLKVQPEENKLLTAYSSSSYQWYSQPTGSIHVL